MIHLYAQSLRLIHSTSISSTVRITILNDQNNYGRCVS